MQRTEEGTATYINVVVVAPRCVEESKSKILYSQLINSHRSLHVQSVSGILLLHQKVVYLELHFILELQQRRVDTLLGRLKRSTSGL